MDNRNERGILDKGIITFDELKRVTGYSRAADIERCLKEQGIRYFWGKEGYWTTLYHLNNPYGQGYTRQQHQRIEF